MRPTAYLQERPPLQVFPPRSIHIALQCVRHSMFELEWK